MLLLFASCEPADVPPAKSAAASPSSLPQPTQAQLEAAGLGDLPVAAAEDRLDVAAPTFSSPTEITNPLFPISELRSAILSGKVDDKPFHTETTLLPETKLIEWPEGETVETRVSQYVAYLDGRIQEAALDFYAQADDGSVWYFGEEVNDYRGGAAFSTEGTWLAGKDGPPAMIMPGDPRVGDVHRAENIPGVAFEEVAIKTIDKTVPGPTGPVKGALVARELHDDGTYSDKVFAPGYGEFYSAHQGEVEAMALAVPADSTDEPEPPELHALSSITTRLFSSTQHREWKRAALDARRAQREWGRYKEGAVPPWLLREGNRAIEALLRSVRARDEASAGSAAIDVAQTAVDLKLRYREPVEIDLGRATLWARQVVVDARAGDLAAVTGDGAVLDWIRGRFGHALGDLDTVRVNSALLALGESIGDKDLGAARKGGEQLIDTLEELRPAD
ncbi:MAG: hypothetical protein QOH26_2104 [Actinomycetota bacterium]|nr:hypothetical protein [Actinomycetota bacterium]